jgi:hypothetical protein
MEISFISSAIRVGYVIENPNIYKGSKYVLYSNGLKLIYDSNFPKNLKSKHLSLIYFFVINGKIYKIGQSSGKDGIKGCMGFYLNAGQDSSGPNRFAINYLVRECMKNGDKIEIYMKYEAPIKREVEGLFSKEIREVPPSAKDMEEVAMKDFKSIENEYPLWNFQERGVIIPNEIQKIYQNYKSNRDKK